MNNVLVTGLGSASELGICEPCNLNFTWLFNNPSTLLWADQIYVPKTAYEKAKSANHNKEEKATSLFLSLIEQHGLINKIELSTMYKENLKDEIYKKVLDDSKALLHTFPDVITKGNCDVPDEILIGDQPYCGAWMSSIHLDMQIAKDLDANCLFGQREHNFLKYLYGLSANQQGGFGTNSAYNEVFSIYMPESLKIHHYSFTPEEYCETCKNYEHCKETYLQDTEAAIQKILNWRDYDELQQAKNEIDKIIRIKGQISTAKDVDDVIKQFKERQTTINKNINKRFPQIQRWTKMTTVLATPITIAAALTGNMPLTVGGAIATGLSQATENLLEIYKSKNNWVGFVNSMKDL